MKKCHFKILRYSYRYVHVFIEGKFLISFESHGNDDWYKKPTERKIKGITQVPETAYNRILKLASRKKPPYSEKEIMFIIAFAKKYFSYKLSTNINVSI